MPARLIVSYDGTTNDDDALALAQMLAAGGSTLALAYVRHSREYDPRREEVAEHDAMRRLEHGITWLEDPEIRRHVVLDPSTGAGLAKLAASEEASVVVFGSDYRTPPGRVEPGGAAQVLLSGGPAAVAVAKAGLRLGGHGSIRTISVSPSEDDSARPGHRRGSGRGRRGRGHTGGRRGRRPDRGRLFPHRGPGPNRPQWRRPGQA